MMAFSYTALLYRLMVGLAGFSIGLALMLAYHNIRSALLGDREQWLWMGVRIGYAAIIASLMPLIFLARNLNAPFNWQTWTFLSALVTETICFMGLILTRHRGTRGGLNHRVIGLMKRNET